MMKLAILMMMPAALWAETGSEAWLRYSRTNPVGVPDVVVVLDPAAPITTVLANARQEIVRGVLGMTGKTLGAGSGVPKDNAIVLGGDQIARQYHGPPNPDRNVDPRQIHLGPCRGIIAPVKSIEVRNFAVLLRITDSGVEYEA